MFLNANLFCSLSSITVFPLFLFFPPKFSLIWLFFFCFFSFYILLFFEKKKKQHVKFFFFFQKNLFIHTLVFLKKKSFSFVCTFCLFLKGEIFLPFFFSRKDFFLWKFVLAHSDISFFYLFTVSAPKNLLNFILFRMSSLPLYFSCCSSWIHLFSFLSPRRPLKKKFVFCCLFVLPTKNLFTMFLLCVLVHFCKTLFFLFSFYFTIRIILSVSFFCRALFYILFVRVCLFFCVLQNSFSFFLWLSFLVSFFILFSSKKQHSPFLLSCFDVSKKILVFPTNWGDIFFFSFCFFFSSFSLLLWFF